jgi:hypothetical protein
VHRFIHNLRTIKTRMIYILGICFCLQIWLNPASVLLQSSAYAQTLARMPEGGVEISYVWKRGDSLTSALFNLGIGHDKNGAKIYGRSGWMQKNISFYDRKNWDGIEEGQTVKLIIPKSLSPQAPSPALNQQVEPAQDSPPLSPSQPTATTEDEAKAEAVEEVVEQTPSTATEVLPAPIEVPQSKIETPKRKPKVSAKAIRATSHSLKLAKEHEIALAFFVIFIGISIYVHRQRTVKNLELRMSAVSNSFLSWMVLSGSHQSEHIVMAETLFVGPTSDRALNAYQLMGFFAKDLEMMKVLDERLKLENTLPAIDYSLDPMQEEFLNRFLKVSPKVYFRIIAFSTSPFLQIAALKVMKHHFQSNFDFSNASSLGKELVEACAKYPNLRKNKAVQKQIIDTLTSFESPMDVPKVS